MLTFNEALTTVLENTSRLDLELVRLENSLGRYLAQSIRAKEDHPPFSASAVDGFAMRHDTVTKADESNPVCLQIAESVRAGDDSVSVVSGSCAVRIMTGAQVPTGIDAVVMKEDVIEKDAIIEIRKPVPLGDHIRFQGEDIKKNDEVLVAGTRITPAVVGFLGSLGYASFETYRKPRVVVVTTGDELVALAEVLTPGKLRDSNSSFLVAALNELGIDSPNIFGRVKDDKEELRKVLDEALGFSDVVLVTGGVSVGDYDYVKVGLEELGVAEIFWKVGMKPGKPLFFGKKGDTLVFGLPGNPVAVGVLFYEIVRPAILRMMGEPNNVSLQSVKARLSNGVGNKSNRLEFVRGRLIVKDGNFLVDPIGKRSSNMMSGFAEANCFLILPPLSGWLEKETQVEVHILPTGFASN